MGSTENVVTQCERWGMVKLSCLDVVAFFLGFLLLTTVSIWIGYGKEMVDMTLRGGWLLV